MWCIDMPKTWLCPFLVIPKTHGWWFSEFNSTPSHHSQRRSHVLVLKLTINFSIYSISLKSYHRFTVNPVFWLFLRGWTASNHHEISRSHPRMTQKPPSPGAWSTNCTDLEVGHLQNGHPLDYPVAKLPWRTPLIFLHWSGYMIKHDQTWSNMIKHDQTWSNNH